MLGTVPEVIRGEEVKSVKLSLTVDGLGLDDVLYIDDVGVFSLE